VSIICEGTTGWVRHGFLLLSPNFTEFRCSTVAGAVDDPRCFSPANVVVVAEDVAVVGSPSRTLGSPTLSFPLQAPSRTVTLAMTPFLVFTQSTASASPQPKRVAPMTRPTNARTRTPFIRMGGVPFAERGWVPKDSLGLCAGASSGVVPSQADARRPAQGDRCTGGSTAEVCVSVARPDQQSSGVRGQMHARPRPRRRSSPGASENRCSSSRPRGGTRSRLTGRRPLVETPRRLAHRLGKPGVLVSVHEGPAVPFQSVCRW
jgi:hypothetical protein